MRWIILLYVSNIIYGFVNTLFPRCEEIIDNPKTTIQVNFWTNACNNIREYYPPVTNYDFKTIICPKVMTYLYNIYNLREDSLSEVGFKYLYYWIFKYYLKDEKKSNRIKPLYDELLKVYNNWDHKVHSAIAFQENETDDELENLKDIYDLNIKLQGIGKNLYCDGQYRCDCAEQCAKIYDRLKKACISNYDHNLHNLLDKYRNKFINLDLNSACDNIKHLILPLYEDNKQMITSSKSSIVFPRKIPIFFTPYGLRVKRKIKCVKKNWNNEDEKSPIFGFSEKYNSLSMNYNYNLSF
ncbi:variable surface protein [Plasmodium gonderi]|uniref:Variable surface protein n=1 Tax=Plasmodium gonderi TaxID=77519 RepID=A0A1Y1JRB3_PLAGO|nr:variable surface protein [Plasmodium gonderi]GAW84035.1 variable surface protein [Plasmodium gonderi]